MIRQQLLRTEDQFAELSRRRFGGSVGGRRQHFGEGAVGYVVRPDGVQPLVAAADREQVAVRDARVEPHVAAAQPPLEEVDQFGRFGRGDMAGRMVADALLLDRNEVAAHDHFAAPDFDAHAGRFERTASFEDGGNVVPQQREVCDFAARSEPFVESVRRPFRRRG